MACALGFPELASHNPFIEDLDALGYQVGFVNGYLVIYGLPYLNEEGGLEHGDWVSSLDLSGAVIDPPKVHWVWWRGGPPHDHNKRQLRLGGRPARVVVT